MAKKRSTEERLNGLEVAVAAIATALTNGFQTLDKNFESIETRIDAMDKKIDGVENRLHTLEKKVDELAKQSDVSFTSVDGKLDHLTAEVAKIDKVSGYAEEYQNLLDIDPNHN